VQKQLKRIQESYKKMSFDEKREFDQERLTNPFSDTRLFANNSEGKVKRILCGIDISAAEILLANELSKVNKPIDLIISHHPMGKALSGLHEVMEQQIEILANYGIPINIAQGLLRLKISEIDRYLSGYNVNREINTAKILGFPLMCIHTVTDNLAAKFLDNYFKKNHQKIEKVGDLLGLIKEIPEYQTAIRDKIGPSIFCGQSENFVGKIALTEITGGTSGTKDMYEKLAQAGIGTIVGMHIDEEHKKEADKNHINVVIAGHIASDSLGMNLFLDQIEKQRIEIIPCSGLIRIKLISKGLIYKVRK
jgi:putative NIF3 family GTP cyclohydrolase 1 type 2